MALGHILGSGGDWIARTKKVGKHGLHIYTIMWLAIGECAYYMHEQHSKAQIGLVQNLSFTCHECD